MHEPLEGRVTGRKNGGLLQCTGKAVLQKHTHKKIWTLFGKHLLPGILALVILVCGMTAVYLPSTAFSLSRDFPADLSDNITDLTNAADQEETSDIHLIKGSFKSGDTASDVLGLFLPLTEIFLLEKQSRPVFSFTRFKQGQPFEISLLQERFVSFVYDIDDQTRLVIKKEQDSYDIRKIPIQYDIREAVISVSIASSIYAAVKKAGYCTSLAGDLADIFAWDIDFAKDIQPGDRFQVLVKQRYRDDTFQGYGNILAAVFVNKGTVHKAFLFTDADGHAGYYDGNGQSLQKAFLKSPVNFSKITSYFSASRLHPILKTSRPHPGVDYAAPKNTPIKTVADGTITQMAYNNTMGRYITIRHCNGYETSYFHMNAYAAGMKKGAAVFQGDVIGYVGKTGLATGYHLCFRVEKNGKPVNPLKIPQTSATLIASSEKARFAKTIALYSEKLMTAGSLARSTP